MHKVFSRIFLIVAGMSIFQLSFNRDIKEIKISESIENKSLKEVIELIQRKYQVQFSYETSVIRSTTLFTTHVEGLALENFLLAILKEVNLNYRVIGNQIVLYYYEWPKDKPPVKQQARERKPDIKPIGDSTTLPDEESAADDSDAHVFNDTIYHTVYDTFRISLSDTVYIYDTIKIELSYYKDKKKPHTPPNLKTFKPKYSIGIQGGTGGYRSTEPLDIAVENVDILQNTSTLSYKSLWNLGITFEKYLGNAYVQAATNIEKGNKTLGINYISHGIVNEPIIISSSIIISHTGIDTVIETRDNFVEKIDTISEIREHRSVYYLGLPVVVGYDYNLTRRFRAGVLAGVNWNVLLKDKDLSVPGVSYTRLNHSKLNMSILAGMRVSFLLTNKMVLSADVKYHYPVHMEQYRLNYSLLLRRVLY